MGPSLCLEPNKENLHMQNSEPINYSSFRAECSLKKKFSIDNMKSVFTTNHQSSDSLSRKSSYGNNNDHSMGSNFSFNKRKSKQLQKANTKFQKNLKVLP